MTTHQIFQHVDRAFRQQIANGGPWYIRVPIHIGFAEYGEYVEFQAVKRGDILATVSLHKSELPRRPYWKRVLTEIYR